MFSRKWCQIWKGHVHLGAGLLTNGLNVTIGNCVIYHNYRLHKQYVLTITFIPGYGSATSLPWAPSMSKIYRLFPANYMSPFRFKNEPLAVCFPELLVHVSLKFPSSQLKNCLNHSLGNINCGTGQARATPKILSDITALCQPRKIIQTSV